MKIKDKKSKKYIRVAPCQKTAGKNTSLSKNGTIFKRWQKWSFCKGFNKAKLSILGLSLKIPKTYRKHPLKSLESFCAEKS